MTEARKTAAKKAPVKKDPATKATATKATATKATATKATATKATATKATATKATATAAAAGKVPARKAAGKKVPAKKAAASKVAAGAGFTEAERAAMKDRADEVKATRRGATTADDLDTLLGKIAEMQDADRALAEGIHAIVTAAAPELAPRTWYGMPAYAQGGKVVCFFQPAQRFGARYATLGFNDPAHLDDGTMWPTAYALTELSDANATRIEELVRRAVS